MSVYGPWLADPFTAYFTGKTVKALLVTSAYVQNVPDNYRAAITTEAAGTGYTAGGVAVSNVAVAYDGTDLVISCDPVAFGAVDLPDVAGIVFYVDTGNAATDVLLTADTWTTVAAVAADPFTYTPDTQGLIVGGIG